VKDGKLKGDEDEDDDLNGECEEGGELREVAVEPNDVDVSNAIE
jgi:hypothetical protein